MKVTDGDTYRVRHLCAFSALRRDGRTKGEGGVSKLSEETIQIRIAAIDCPETAKFGSTGQAFGDEATNFVEKRLKNRRVTVKLLARDQYQRAVSAVRYGTGPFGLVRRDISEELLKNGLATIYRGAGAEYNGKLERWEGIEEKAKRRRVGIWKKGGKPLETPAEYKKRNKK